MRRRRRLARRTRLGVAALVDRVVRHLQRTFHTAAGKAQRCQREQCHHPANLPTAAHLSRFNPVHSPPTPIPSTARSRNTPTARRLPPISLLPDAFCNRFIPRRAMLRTFCRPVPPKLVRRLTEPSTDRSG